MKTCICSICVFQNYFQKKYVSSRKGFVPYNEEPIRFPKHLTRKICYWVGAQHLFSAPSNLSYISDHPSCTAHTLNWQKLDLRLEPCGLWENAQPTTLSWHKKDLNLCKIYITNLHKMSMRKEKNVATIALCEIGFTKYHMYHISNF